MATLTQLQYIVAVNREKHFGKAAETCHVAQPSLSAQIQKLEDELDTVIFDRSKKPILTTQTGLEIIEQAKIILGEHRKLFSIASQGSIEPKGEFTLAVIPTLSPYLIPLFVGAFSQNFPKVKLKIVEHQTDLIVNLLKEDKIDAGLLVTPLKDDHIIERHLFFEPFYAYVSPQHPLNKKKFLSETDMTDHNLWLLEEGHCFRTQVLKVCSLERQSMALKNVEFASGNLETLKNLVKRNSGYTLLPELALDDLAANEKKQLIRKFRKPVPTREVSLVHSRSFLKENIISALEKTVIENLPNNIRSLKKQEIDLIDLDMGH